MKLLGSIVYGIQISDLSHDKELCIACLEGKLHMVYNKQSFSRATKRLELIHSDSCGPFPTLSITGSKYFILFIDDLTRMTWVYFLKTKTTDEVLQIFQQFKALVEKPGSHQIQCFRYNNRTGEYTNNKFRSLLLKDSIIFEPSAPYTQS